MSCCGGHGSRIKWKLVEMFLISRVLELTLRPRPAAKHLSLCSANGEDNYVRAESLRQFHPHVPNPPSPTMPTSALTTLLCRNGE